MRSAYIRSGYKKSGYKRSGYKRREAVIREAVIREAVIREAVIREVVIREAIIRDTCLPPSKLSVYFVSPVTFFRKLCSFLLSLIGIGASMKLCNELIRSVCDG